jgi:hypothetical protein
MEKEFENSLIQIAIDSFKNKKYGIISLYNELKELYDKYSVLYIKNLILDKTLTYDYGHSRAGIIDINGKKYFYKDEYAIVDCDTLLYYLLEMFKFLDNAINLKSKFKNNIYSTPNGNYIVDVVTVIPTIIISQNKFHNISIGYLMEIVGGFPIKKLIKEYRTIWIKDRELIKDALETLLINDLEQYKYYVDDFHLENVMWNNTEKKLILIDLDKNAFERSNQTGNDSAYIHFLFNYDQYGGNNISDILNIIYTYLNKNDSVATKNAFIEYYDKLLENSDFAEIFIRDDFLEKSFFTDNDLEKMLIDILFEYIKRDVYILQYIFLLENENNIRKLLSHFSDFLNEGLLYFLLSSKLSLNKLKIFLEFTRLSNIDYDRLYEYSTRNSKYYDDPEEILKYLEKKATIKKRDIDYNYIKEKIKTIQNVSINHIKIYDEQRPVLTNNVNRIALNELLTFLNCNNYYSNDVNFAHETLFNIVKEHGKNAILQKGGFLQYEKYKKYVMKNIKKL